MLKFVFFVFFLMAINLSKAIAGQAESTSLHNGQKIALIFGVAGQDGQYLAEFLINKNYQVHGVARKMTNLSIDALIDHPNFILHTGDITNNSNLIQLIQNIRPDEIYNLAAQSNVKVSFDLPEETAEINALGPLRILETIRLLGLGNKIRFFQASSSELFGRSRESPQTEETEFYPRSPYGVSKLYAYWITVNYRESYGFFACNGILFNHESPLRGDSFVTRKITLAACRYKLGLQNVLHLGNLDAKRDWGYAKDYVEAMWLMLQQKQPDDFVIATGEEHSVREFIELAYRTLGIEIEWKGNGSEEYGIDRTTGETIIQIDPKYYRPIETDRLLGKADKAHEILQWKPKTSLLELVKLMIEADYKKVLDTNSFKNSTKQ